MYDAFISYSHAKDRTVAAALQRGLHRLARRWYRASALKVFRDDTSLSATPHLWGSIEQALRGSRYFVLMASPESAASPWVCKEIACWQEEREPGTFLIVVTAGEVRWEGDDFDWSRTTALPRQLSGWFRAEPLWVVLDHDRDEDQLTLRNAAFRAAVCKLAAPMHGIAPDDLDGEDVRQFRVASRLRRAAVSGLGVLTVIALVLGFVALQQRSAALDQARIATARALAAEGESLAARDPVLAARLAVAAYRLDSSPQTISALMREMDRRSHDAGYLERSPGSVGSEGRVFEETRAGRVAISPDGSLVAVGPHSGSDIRLWQTGDRRLAATLPSGVSGAGNVPVSVTFTSDGTRLVLMFGPDAEVWNVASRERVYRRTMPDFFHAVSVSPDGTEIGLSHREVDGRLEGTYVTSTTSPDAEIVPVAKGDDSQKALRERLRLPTSAVSLAEASSTVEAFDVDTGRRLAAKQLPGSVGRWTTAATGGNTVVAADDQGQLVALDGGLTRTWQLGQMPSTVLYLDVSRDGSLAVAADNRGNVLLLRPLADRRFDVLPGTAGRLGPKNRPEEQWLVPSPDGRHLLVHRQGKVELWRLDQRRMVAEHPTDHTVVSAAPSVPESSAIAFSADGTRFAVAAGGRVTTRETESSREVASTDGTDARAAVLGDAARLPEAEGPNTWSRFGAAIAFAERRESDDHTVVQVWSEGRKVGEVGYDGKPLTLAVSRDAAHLVVAGARPQADVVEVATGERTPLVAGYGPSPDPQGTEHAFAGTGGLLVQQVTPNRDANELRNRLLLWHWETGSLIGEWPDPFQLAYPGQQDHHVVAAGDHTALTVLVDGGIAAWRVSPEAWADSLCDTFGDLDQAQQATYQPQGSRGNVCR